MIAVTVGHDHYLVIMNCTRPALSLQRWQVIVRAMGQDPFSGYCSIEWVLFILQTSPMVTAYYNI